MSKTNYINHIAFVIDMSGSMIHLRDETIKAFDTQIQFLAKRSTEVDQETRVSIYLFNETNKCIVYDRDVLRLPSLKDIYRPSDGTALIDATLDAINDLKKTPEIHADHAFLCYVITDGYENRSRQTAKKLSETITELEDNWTMGIFVPDKSGENAALSFGFPENNISIWDISSAKGLADASAKIQTSTNTFFAGRAAGVRGTRSLFKVNVNVTPSQVKKKLTELPVGNYKILQAAKDEVIREFVEKKIGTFVKGNSFYQLQKAETVQATKQIIIQDTATNKVYSGDAARQMLNLPNQEINVKPGDFKSFRIFIQSTSINRKIPTGSKLLVLT